MVTRDKEGHYLMIMGSIHQEYITIVNIYAHNIRAPIKQILTALKGEETAIQKELGSFHVPLSTMDRSLDRKSIRKHWT